MRTMIPEISNRAVLYFCKVKTVMFFRRGNSFGKTGELRRSLTLVNALFFQEETREFVCSECE